TYASENARYVSSRFAQKIIAAPGPGAEQSPCLLIVTRGRDLRRRGARDGRPVSRTAFLYTRDGSLPARGPDPPAAAATTFRRTGAARRRTTRQNAPGAPRARSRRRSLAAG